MSSADFDGYYQTLYGPRWSALRAALLSPGAAVPFDRGLREAYTMDRASVLAAASLVAPEEGLVLDACAAPGGKSLVIMGSLPEGARLLANELSSDRRRRLSDVLDRHLTVESRKRATVSGFDAAALGGRKGEHGRFAAILLDAPCSSERHVLGDRKALDEWTQARPRSLSRRQWSLLSSAFLLLAPGGSLVYSTCALTPEENDGPVGRLLKKYGDAVELHPLDFAEGKPTAYGRLILPDECGGMGPMYVARFKKKS
jgi:16S rRNA C967 or C1407 C5-methylase (RsmB/RsmF family)